jgi:hypothetical protein
MKKALLYLLAGVALAVVAGLGVAYYKLNAIVKVALETEGPRVTQTTVSLDSVSLLPFSGTGSIRGLAIGNPPGYKTPWALRAGSVKVAVDLKSLRSDRILIKQIIVDAPQVTLEGKFSGNNLSQLQKNIEAYSSAPRSGKAAEQAKVVIGLFKVTRGKVSLALSELGNRSLTEALPDVEKRDIGRASGGATVSQAANEMLGAITAAALKAAEGASGLGKVKSAEEKTRKAGKSAGSTIKGWFHRKK